MSHPLSPAVSSVALCLLFAVAGCASRSAERPEGATAAEAPVATGAVPPATSSGAGGTGHVGSFRPQPHPVRTLPADQTPPQVVVDAARQVDSARKAQAEGRLERLSTNARPTPFDRASYLRDPTVYLNQFEPCRIWQTAEPGPGVDELATPDGYRNLLVTVQPGGRQVLQVQTLPGYPATFTSQDRGAFHNDLTSVTVQADAGGVASATFTATAGTTDTVRIIAASPVTSGQVDIRISIPAAP